MARIAALTVLVMALVTGCIGSRPIATVPAPAALPAAALAAPTQRTIEYPHGRFILYGNGSTVSPYAWVWVPAGATPPRAR